MNEIPGDTESETEMGKLSLGTSEDNNQEEEEDQGSGDQGDVSGGSNSPSSPSEEPPIIQKVIENSCLRVTRAMAPSRSEETSLGHRSTSRTHLGDGASNYMTRNPSPVSSPLTLRKNTSRRVKSAANLNEKSNNNNMLYEHDLENRVQCFLTVPQVILLEEPPPRSLKESKWLLTAPRDLTPTYGSPRWPAECQVLPERIRHIKSVPNIPELFYDPTGKEPQPRPLGEVHGLLVYDYQPTSSVNYFSRSVSGPAGNGGPPEPGSTPIDPKVDFTPLPDSLKFESRFESGNLAKVIRITEAYYELYLRPDFYTSKHCQWFYFRVQNMRSDLTYRFSIVNFSKPDSLYNYGMKPVLYSQIEAERHFVGWSRVGSNIRYYRNESMFDEEDGYSYTLTFSINFPHDNDTVYLAHCYPYTYSDLQDDLAEIQNNEERARFCCQRLLCRTLAGNNVYILTITSPGTQEDLKRKQVIVLTARVHPGETPSSWIMRGMINFLVSDSQVAKELRDKFIFKIVPMLNPDGVIVGNTRCSLTARDLNRQYKSVIKEAFPPVFHVKTLVRRLMEEGGVAFYCDLHAHSRKFNVFIYGCENRRHSEKFLKEQIFPLMLHKNTAEKFSFEDCRFKIQRQKESTGRVVFWSMGITCSYTLEASYGGTNLGSRAFTHFNTDDYEGIGRYFCETLLDFQDPCPVKEQLRTKILGRLHKEGSNADEPANIALSDYSSLSSGADNSSSDCCNDDEDEEEQEARRQEKNRQRKMRSRRERCRNNGGQFNNHQNPYRTLNNAALLMMKKSDSDKTLNNGKPPKPGKKAKRKFKRSLTMTSLPLSFFKVCTGGGNGKEGGGSLEGSTRDLSKLEFSNNDSKNNNNNNHKLKNMTRFTIGTSDESDDEEEDDSRQDLERLFCPLTDSNGAPFSLDDDSNAPWNAYKNDDQLSASSCRMVQAEILASVNRIRCSILGRKGGLLHSYGYGHGIDQLANNSSPEDSRSQTPMIAKGSVPSTPGGFRPSSKTKKKKVTSTSILVQLPSPAGSNKKTQNSSSSTNGLKTPTKEWTKYSTIRKACKMDGRGFETPKAGSSANFAAYYLDAGGSETPPPQRLKKTATASGSLSREGSNKKVKKKKKLPTSASAISLSSMGSNKSGKLK